VEADWKRPKEEVMPPRSSVKAGMADPERANITKWVRGD
jgi:hypothetical protein